MTADDLRKYNRIKQRESRARRRPNNSQPKATATLATGPFTPSPNAPRSQITANVQCKASIEEIAALGAVRGAAFMSGVARVIAAMSHRL